MVFPMYGTHQTEPASASGDTYAMVLTRDEDTLPALREIRFTGWLSRPDNGWLVAVAGAGERATAAGRRGVVGVGETLAGRLPGPVLAIRVLRDLQLVLVAWTGGEEITRYVSDPSREPGADPDVLAEPVGAEDAAALAEATGHPGAADDLAEILAEELDPESVFESERLGRVLRLLHLPTWLVAASTLPHDIPTGPSRTDLLRLGAGIPGLPALLTGPVAALIRKRLPPPVLPDPPRGTKSGMDPWLM